MQQLNKIHEEGRNWKTTEEIARYRKIRRRLKTSTPYGIRVSEECMYQVSVYFRFTCFSSNTTPRLNSLCTFRELFFKMDSCVPTATGM